jgi:hypothetical protein
MYIQQAPAPMASSSQQYYDQSTPAAGTMAVSSSIGSLPQMHVSASGPQLCKTDSHAVLMELFARDQDLVRQASESVKGGQSGGAGQLQGMQTGQQQQQPGHPFALQPQQVSSQHPMRIPSQGRLGNVPTLNSWPHFSSVSSLNNLGTMPGVKSITSLSGVDLANQGPVNRFGNLAQVKSVESMQMGMNDSYAFLEVFFGDRSSSNISSALGGSKDHRGTKRERDEDNDVGLSLEDESPSMSNIKHEFSGGSGAPSASSELAPTPFMMSSGNKDGNDTTGTLKRAYDDALAARGLMSVSRSSEKLTDLALPEKMQRTLSQEYLRPQQAPQAQTHQYGQYQYMPQASSPAPAEQSNLNQSQQYPGQHPGQQQYQAGDHKRITFMSDPSDTNASIEVPSATKCALCHQTNVDTQLRPCGHMFHERCLKPSLQAPMGAPKCPVDHIPMQSALLAVPTDDQTQPRQPAPWGASATAPAPVLPHPGAGQAIKTESQQSNS